MHKQFRRKELKSERTRGRLHSTKRSNILTTKYSIQTKHKHKTFFQAFGSNTSVSSNYKQGTDQRSLFEGGSEKKKPTNTTTISSTTTSLSPHSTNIIHTSSLNASPRGSLITNNTHSLQREPYTYFCNSEAEPLWFEPCQWESLQKSKWKLQQRKCLNFVATAWRGFKIIQMEFA